MDKSKKVVTGLDAKVATPISISKSAAYEIANKQTKLNNTISGINEEAKAPENIAEIKQVEEVDFKRVNQINDFIRIEKKRTPILTYIIMISILIFLITIFIIFELPILRGL